MNKVNWGILGYAAIAREKAIAAILEAPSAHLYALASTDPEERKEAEEKESFEVFYEEYEALLKDPRVDAVYIPLPNSLHKEWTVKALSHGKHVLCEKPLGLSEEEAEHMMKKSEEHQKLLMEGFMYRYTPKTRKVLEILESCALGELRHIGTSFRFTLEDAEDIRMDRSLGGGALYDVGSYGVNFMTLLMKKEPLSILGTKKMEKGVDVQSTVLFEYPGGITGTIHSGFNSFEKNYAEIIGTLGRLEIPDPFLYGEGVLTWVHGEGEEKIPVSGCESFAPEFEDFSRAVLNSSLPELSLTESVLNARILDRIFAVL